VAAQEIPKSVTLRLVFRESVVARRRRKLERVIQDAGGMLNDVTVEVEYRE